MDENGQKWTKLEKQKNLDNIGQNWTIEKIGQIWTKMDHIERKSDKI